MFHKKGNKMKKILMISISIYLIGASFTNAYVDSRGKSCTSNSDAMNTCDRDGACPFGLKDAICQNGKIRGCICNMD